MKFILFVEGDTEREAAPNFLRRCLCPPRLSQSVGITPVKFEGFAQFLGKAAKKAHMYLEGPSSAEIIAVVGLLDLYGPHRQGFYPDNLASADERYEWAVRKIESEVGHRKFRMFFAVHEFEAWLLSEPQHLPASVADSLPPNARAPEAVDFDEPPAKLLHRLYREKLHRNYKKMVDGPRLFEKLDPEAARSRCPRLKAMLDQMLAFAKEAGL